MQLYPVHFMEHPKQAHCLENLEHQTESEKGRGRCLSVGASERSMEDKCQHLIIHYFIK